MIRERGARGSFSAGGLVTLQRTILTGAYGLPMEGRWVIRNVRERPR